MRLAVAVALTVGLVAGACSIANPDLLGGRQKCWPESEPRLATLMEGTLELGPANSTLDTSEGERFKLAFPSLAVKTDPATGLVSIVDRQGATLASDGELVTLFGGLGADGAIVVCAIEERHSSDR